MTFYGECYEFDVASAAKTHASYMLDAHGDAGHSFEFLFFDLIPFILRKKKRYLIYLKFMENSNKSHNMSTMQRVMFDKMKEIRTLTNWEKLRFVIGHNKTG